MTPQAREQMRLTIRRALDRTPGPAPTHPGAFALPPTSPSAASASDLAQRFSTEAAALGGTVHAAESLDEVVQIILSVRAALGGGDVLAWDEEQLPVHGILECLRTLGICIVAPSADTLDSHPHRAALASASVGLTGADAGLSDSGSIVVTSGPGRCRLASLLPPAHVVLLPRSRIAPSLSVLLATRPDLVTAGSNFVCITGPSRTADIEHTLSRGVHGPGQLHIVLLPGYGNCLGTSTLPH